MSEDAVKFVPTSLVLWSLVACGTSLGLVLKAVLLEAGTLSSGARRLTIVSSGVMLGLCVLVAVASIATYEKGLSRYLGLITLALVVVDLVCLILGIFRLAFVLSDTPLLLISILAARKILKIRTDRLNVE
ncbi:hypothetical protein JOF29_006053 [Kribbella aluminosa]|uniref:Uncharacterized protein n=1 Tax=Kribbella aluminosa TaxID=416017 RepID=A0ABS4UTH5_9ACTN|nr:hypothetical protein [Kribbella aluminosa]MBP2354943.1 hypothetical protein [Kribbella aluminosa]